MERGQNEFFSEEEICSGTVVCAGICVCQCGLSSFDTEDFGSVVRRQFWRVEGIVFPAVSEHSAFGWMFQRAGAQSEKLSQSGQAVLSGENTGSYFCKTQRATFLGAGSGIFISI